VRSEVLPSLADLAATANREHALVGEAVVSAFEHACAAGRALSRVRGQLPAGEWRAWLDVNFDGADETAQAYVRLAIYHDEIPFAQRRTIKTAKAYLAGLPALHNGGRPAPPVEAVAEARRLRGEGLSLRAIAERLGVTVPTAMRWCEPEKSQRKRRHERDQRRRKAARAREALRQQELMRLSRKINGPVGKSYQLVRQTAEALHQAWADCDEVEQRKVLTVAQRKLYEAEDLIAKAVRVAGQTATATAVAPKVQP
jgi:transposase